ncbi:MAG: AAA family ATPase [Flavobacteriaceae bacterium]
MIIQKVELNNFKSYYGNQVFNFKNGLNIVSGKIGTGKTSLYEAFQWVLLDSMSFKDNIDEDFILNKKFEFESLQKNINQIESSVTIFVEEDSIVYRIKKENVYTIKNNDCQIQEINTSISFEEPRTGNSKVILDRREVESKLDELFPEKLRKYLLFKGETLNQLIDFSNPNTLEQAVKQISYLPLFSRMSRIIDDIIEKTDRKYRNKLQANARDQKKSQQLNYDLESKQRDLTAKKDKFKQAKIDIEKLEEKEKEYTEKLSFVAGFPDLKEEENRLEYQRKRAFDNLETIDKESKQLFINKWIIAKSHPLLDKAEVELRKFISWRQNEIAVSREQLELGVPGDHLIRRMVKERKCLICGTTEKDNPDLIKIIETHLDENKKVKNLLSDEVEDLNEKVMDIVKNISPIKTSTSDIKRDLKNHILRNKEKEGEIASINEALKKTKEKIEDLIKEKGYQILELDPKTITSAIQRVKGDLATKRSQKEFYDKQVRGLESEIRGLNKKFEELVGLEEIDVNEIPEKKSLNYLYEIKQIIDKKVDIEKNDLIEKIENEANKIQKSIIQQSKDNDIIVLYVKISKDDYSISFVDKDGNPNPGHGAQETLAKMSLISSVLKLSNEYKGESYPFIVDAPTSNFDDTITKPFIKSVSENFTQGLVILKDIHLEIDAYKNEEFTKSIHTIEKSSDTPGESSIINSYTIINPIK